MLLLSVARFGYPRLDFIHLRKISHKKAQKAQELLPPILLCASCAFLWLNIKAEVNYVAFLHDVVFALES